ncbi:hypothetical protein GCM10028801_31390 [Nocardioides maradonensis]
MSEIEAGSWVRFASRPTFRGKDATDMSCPDDWLTGTYCVQSLDDFSGGATASLEWLTSEGMEEASFDLSCLALRQRDFSTPEKVIAWLSQ